MTQPASKRLLTEARLGAVNGAAAVGADGKVSTPLPDLSASYAKRDLNVLVALGDSLTQQGGDIPANFNRSPVSFWTWGNSFLGHRLKIMNAGIGGQTSAQILARVQADVIAAAPGWCHVVAGTNDMTGLTGALATAKTNITAILDALNAAGIRVVLGTIPPRATYTGTQRADTEALNDWIRSLAYTRRGVIIADYYAALVDPATGAYLAGMSGDGIHLSEKGGAATGRIFADALSTRVPNVRRLSHVNGDSQNLLTGGRFAGTGSAVPTGWSVQGFAGGAAVISRIPRTDGITGTWLQLVVPNGSAGYLQGPNTAVDSGYAVGDALQFLVEYQATGLDTAPTAAGTQALNAVLQTYNGSTFTMKYADLYADAATLPFGATDRSGVFETPPLVVPAGTQIVQPVINITGGGTYRFDCPTLRKV